jgi:hypothetical protein
LAQKEPNKEEVGIQISLPGDHKILTHSILLLTFSREQWCSDGTVAKPEAGLWEGVEGGMGGLPLP